MKLEKLLSLLSDNVWHNIAEITEALEIPQDKIQRIIEFLAEADLVQHSPQTNQIKINQNWKTSYIMPKETIHVTQGQPETAAFGTIIMPPQKTLVIQCTRITNLTNNNLELEIRINKKLREIAITEIR